MKYFLSIFITLLSSSLGSFQSNIAVAATADEQGATCPGIFQHAMKQLHSSTVLDLCSVSDGRPVLLVNTASYCGFTDQFADLEAIHQKYKEKGLVVIGVSSDSFDQEDQDESKAAEVCFKNFGVSFTMLSTVPVRGDQAHPLFQEVARQQAAPKWNFYKYLIDRHGHVVSFYSSFTLPNDNDIEALLAADS